MGYNYSARCSQQTCRHLTPFERKEGYHCSVKGCRNDKAVCEQHSPKGRELLDARLKKDGKY